VFYSQICSTVSRRVSTRWPLKKKKMNQQSIIELWGLWFDVENATLNKQYLKDVKKDKQLKRDWEKIQNRIWLKTKIKIISQK
jgi:hypothetical protein